MPAWVQCEERFPAAAGLPGSGGGGRGQPRDGPWRQGCVALLAAGLRAALQ